MASSATPRGNEQTEPFKETQTPAVFKDKIKKNLKKKGLSTFCFRHCIKPTALTSTGYLRQLILPDLLSLPGQLELSRDAAPEAAPGVK